MCALGAPPAFGQGSIEDEAIYEAEVVVGMPLVLKLPSAEAATKLLGRARALRVDKLANRISFKWLHSIEPTHPCRTVAQPGARAQGTGRPPPRHHPPTAQGTIHPPPGRHPPAADRIASARGRRQLVAITTVLEARERARAEAGLAGQSALAGDSSRGPTKQQQQQPSASLAAIVTGRSSGAPRAAVATLCSQAVSRPAHSLVVSGRLEVFNRLNRSQEAACAAAAAGTLTLIQGPPGTGKTATALAVLQAWVYSGCLGGGSALATSDSNIAVDNLLEGLAMAGVRVVRLGRPDSVRPELLRYCPDAQKGPGGAQSGADKAADHAARLQAIRSAQVGRVHAHMRMCMCTWAPRACRPAVPRRSRTHVTAACHVPAHAPHAACSRPSSLRPVPAYRSCAPLASAWAPTCSSRATSPPS